MTASPLLPHFDADGLLPEGDYDLTLAEIRRSMLVHGGDQRDAGWDESWRTALAANLSVVVQQLWSVGIDEVFIDGSFVEDKAHPNDIDGYFVCDAGRFATGELEASLNRVDPAKCWTWDHASRRPYRGYPKRQLPMWHAYRVELYPHFAGLIAGVNERGHALEFPAFFRQCRRTGRSKGIVRVMKETTVAVGEKA